jgi:hypothetical protein
MQSLADIATDLLCAVTFQPSGGHDPEETAALEQDAWQTLIHGLSPEELAAVQTSVRRAITDLESRPSDTLPEHLQGKLAILKQFLDGELQ